MKVGAGAEQIESVAYHFTPDLRASDLRALADHAVSIVSVNGREVARVPLCMMAASGWNWFLHSVGLPVSEGDEVTATLECGAGAGLSVRDGLTVTAALLIVGRLNGARLRWMSDPRFGWICAAAPEIQ